jgi:hypothetical protein
MVQENLRNPERMDRSAFVVRISSGERVVLLAGAAGKPGS